MCLRAGQTVGTVEDVDSICGRTNAQLQLTADEFDILLCHYLDKDTLQRLDRSI